MIEPFLKSLVVKTKTKEVIKRYSESSCHEADSDKAMWGSEESMLSRFFLGLNIIDFSNIEDWLDVGCSTGRFFSSAEEKGFFVNRMVGVDFSSAIIKLAREREFIGDVEFLVGSLESLPSSIGNFDLVSLVGVLQLCGFSPEKAILASVAKIKSGGQIFVTTKNLGWKAFKDPKIKPDKSHSWFYFDEIEDVFRRFGVKIETFGGLETKGGSVVPLEEAHTMFLLGSKL